MTETEEDSLQGYEERILETLTEDQLDELIVEANLKQEVNAKEYSRYIEYTWKPLLEQLRF